MVEGYVRFICNIFGENYIGDFKKSIDSVDRNKLMNKIHSMVSVLNNKEQIKIIAKFDLKNKNESYDGDVSSIINKLKKYSKDLYHYLFKNIDIEVLVERVKNEVPKESFVKRNINVNNMNGYDYEQIANIYERGEGVPVNKELAYEWYLKSVETNEYYGYLGMLHCYRDGIGVKKNDYEYFKWLLELVTVHISVPAVYEEISKCYEYGLGTEVDKSKSKKYKDIAFKVDKNYFGYIFM